jgi:hypothetical protein
VSARAATIRRGRLARPEAPLTWQRASERHDRKSARFHYDWGPAPDHYFGEVHVDDGGGIRFECWTAGLNANLDPRHVALEPPDYFDGCLALVGQEVRLDCLIAGLHIGESFPECPAESG